MELTVNSLMDWQVEANRWITTRVLWIDPSSRGFWMINIDDPRAWPEWCSRAELNEAMEQDSVAPRLNDPHLPDQLRQRPESHYLVRDKRWDRIRELVADEPAIYDPATRGHLIAGIAQRDDVRLATFYDWLRQYWQRGMTPDALLPDWHHCGARGKPRGSKPGKKRGRPPTKDPRVVGINIDEDLRQLIRVTAKKLYNNRKKPSIQTVYEEIRLAHFVAGYRESDGTMVPIFKSASDSITYRQVRYWLQKEVDLLESMRKREGEHRITLTKRALPGDAAGRVVDGPGARFEADATPVDSWLVSRRDPNKILGRATIYTIIDVFSRLITGIWVGWEHPSWLGAMMALENMMSDKVAFCAAHGITIRPEEWPSHHVPRALVSDRGELFSQHANQLIRHLHIERITAPPYRGDLKPYVERHFGKLREDVRALPGGIQDRDRGERDYRLSAALDLEDFTQVLIHLVLEHNNTVVSKGFRVPKDMSPDVLLTPATIWQWGVEHRAGLLRTVSLPQLRYSLLPHRSASITREGVLASTQRYTADWAQELQWFAKAALVGPQTIEVAYDPRSVDGLWWQDSDGVVRELVLRPEDQREVGGLSWDEAAAWRAVVAERRATTRNDTDQATATHRAHIHAITENATKRAKRAQQASGLSAKERLKDRVAHRQEERRQQREAERWMAPAPQALPRPIEAPDKAEISLLGDLERIIPDGENLDE